MLAFPEIQQYIPDIAIFEAGDTLSKHIQTIIVGKYVKVRGCNFGS